MKQQTLLEHLASLAGELREEIEPDQPTLVAELLDTIDELFDAIERNPHIADALEDL